MADTATAKTQDIRISAEELKRRLDAWESATILDGRGSAAWNGGTDKIQGAIRIDPLAPVENPPWPKDRLTVAYCT